MTEDFTISLLPVAVPQQVFSEERVSLVESATIELREESADVGETEVLRETQVVFVPQAERQIEDDWFVLLDVPPREPSFVPPGIESSSPYTYFHHLWRKCLTIFFTLFDISCHGRVCTGLS